LRITPVREGIVALLLAGFFWCLGVGIIVSGANPPRQKEKGTPTTAQDRFQGSWLVVWQEHDGKAVPLTALQKAGAKIAVRGDRMRWQSKLGTEKLAPEDSDLTFRLDPPRNPQVIRGKASTGPRKGKTRTGLYEFLLNAEALRICWDSPDGERSFAEFHAEKGSGRLRLDLVREETQKAAEKAESQRKPDKTISLEGVRGKKRWKEVLEWLADQTGIPVVWRSATGLPNIAWPKENLKYSIGEVMDILNESLQADEENVYIVLRRPSSYSLYPANTKIPPELLPAVAPEDFYKWGNTEWVKTRIRLKTLDAAVLAKHVQKLLGPIGEASVVDGELAMQDAVGRLRYICRIIHKIDAEGKK
jgi:uncharacterized protein (TIGR03067 family)